MKSKHTSRFILAACLCAVLSFGAVACGPDTNGNNGGGELTIDEFEDETRDLLGSTFCEAVYQCPEEQNPGTTTFLSRYGDQSTCNQQIFGLLGDEFNTNFSEPIDRGLAEYNPDKAQECLDAFQDITSDACFSFDQLEDSPVPACDEIVTGLQPEGAACDSDEHCASGNCDTSVDTGECWNGECAAAQTQEIETKAEGESCGGEFERCDSDAGLVCDRSEDGQSSICVAEDSRAEGTICGSAAVCNPGLACLEDGDDRVCTSVTLNAEGESCDLQETFCQPGLVCGFSLQGGIPSGSCVPPKEQGEDCFSNFSCKYDLQCEGVNQMDGTPGTCQPLLGEGESCQNDFDCQNDLSCEGETDAKTCQAPEEPTACEIPVEG